MNEDNRRSSALVNEVHPVPVYGRVLPTDERIQFVGNPVRPHGSACLIHHAVTIPDGSRNRGRPIELVDQVQMLNQSRTRSA